MSFNYPLSDLVSRLNVSAKRRLASVHVFNSDLTLRVLQVLYANGVIRGFAVRSDFIVVFLKYFLGLPAFKSITVISKPGCRVYWRLGRLSLFYNYRNFSGFFIISSSKGLLTSNDSLLGLRLTGEVLLQVSI